MQPQVALTEVVELHLKISKDSALFTSKESQTPPEGKG